MQSRVVLLGSRISQRDELLYTLATGLAQYKHLIYITLLYLLYIFGLMAGQWSTVTRCRQWQ